MGSIMRMLLEHGAYSRESGQCLFTVCNVTVVVFGPDWKKSLLKGACTLHSLHLSMKDTVSRQVKTLEKCWPWYLCLPMNMDTLGTENCPQLHAFCGCGVTGLV